MKQKITILGSGESGTGAALLAHSLGYEVWVSEGAAIKPVYKKELEEQGIAYEEGGHTREKVLAAGCIVKSPGISPQMPLLQEATQQGIEVIGEVEFAARHTKRPIIGITGSNGKTTTTLLTHHLLKKAGRKAVLAGNVGHSLARAVWQEKEAEIFVTELSSYQLEDIVHFRPAIAVLLNITPDHLDRYGGSFERYAAAKFNLLRNMGSGDTLVYNADDDAIASRLATYSRDVQLVDFSVKSPAMAYADTKGLVFNLPGVAAHIPNEVLPLPGDHNKMNTLAAVAVALLLGVQEEQIIKALPAFRNYPDRLEYITSIGKVDFVNDSKATNVEAVYYALTSFDRPIVWIAGGQDKGNDYRQIAGLVAKRVKALVCLGADNSKLKEFFGDMVPQISETTDVEEAAALAWQYADNRDVVLLSPACASFDLFDNYAQRGAMFKEAVLKLKQRIDDCQN